MQITDTELQNILTHLKPLQSSEQDVLPILFEEKKQRIAEMSEYNKRLDKLILLYLTAVYAAVGLKVSGTLNLKSIYEMLWLPYIFSFLNFCMIIHCLSVSCWLMSLAKYVHVVVDKDITSSFSTNTIIPPTLSQNQWDDWNDPLKMTANLSRNSVTLLWMIMILCLSLYSFTLINLTKLFNCYAIYAWLGIAALCIMLVYAVFLGVSILTCIGNYHKETYFINQKLNLAISVCISASIVLSAVCLVPKLNLPLSEKQVTPSTKCN